MVYRLEMGDESGGPGVEGGSAGAGHGGHGADHYNNDNQRDTSTSGPPAKIDRNTTIFLLNDAAQKYSFDSVFGAPDTLSERDVTDEVVEKFGRTQKTRSDDIANRIYGRGYDEIKPLQLSIGPYISAGPVLFKPLIATWVPSTGVGGIATDFSVSMETGALQEGIPSSVCAGVELGVKIESPPGFDLNVGVECSAQLGPLGVSVSPGEGASVRFEKCIEAPTLGNQLSFKCGAKASRGLEQPLSKPKESYKPPSQLKLP